MQRPRPRALAAALWMTTLSPLAMAQTGNAQPQGNDTAAQKQPAKPSAQGGPEAAASGARR